MRVVNLAKVALLGVFTCLLCACSGGSGVEALGESSSPPQDDASILSLDGQTHLLSDSVLFRETGKPGQLMLQTTDEALTLFFSAGDGGIEAGQELGLRPQDLAQVLSSNYQGTTARSGSLSVREKSADQEPFILSGELQFRLEDGREFRVPFRSRVERFVPSEGSSALNSPVDEEEIFRQATQQQ